MTKKVYNTEEIELQGWKTPIELRPLTIKYFRRVAKVLDTISNPGEDDKDRLVVDILLEATALCMEQFEPKLADPDKLADYVDMPTMEHILNVATGVKVNDPNPQVATADGTN